LGHGFKNPFYFLNGCWPHQALVLFRRNQPGDALDYFGYRFLHVYIGFGEEMPIIICEFFLDVLLFLLDATILRSDRDNSISAPSLDQGVMEELGILVPFSDPMYPDFYFHVNSS
jgi:hypothetical protein